MYQKYQHISKHWSLEGICYKNHKICHIPVDKNFHEHTSQDKCKHWMRDNNMNKREIKMFSTIAVEKYYLNQILLNLNCITDWLAVHSCSASKKKKVWVMYFGLGAFISGHRRFLKNLLNLNIIPNWLVAQSYITLNNKGQGVSHNDFKSEVPISSKRQSLLVLVPHD